MSYSDFESEIDPDRELTPLIQAILPKLTPCRVREYQPDDLEACIEIYRSNELDYLNPAGLDAFIEYLTVGPSYFLVIEYDGGIVACGGLELVGDADTASLQHGMVLREYHRRGFGTTLLAARLSLLEPEVRPVEVWIKTPTRSLPFYTYIGFAPQSKAGKITEKGFANVWMSLDDQDTEDIRLALEERTIQIFLNDPTDEEDEEEY